MRYGLPVLALVTALLASAFLIGGGRETVNAQAAGDVLTFEAVGDSGISGTATLTAVGDDVEIVLAVSGLVDGNTYLSGAYNSTSVVCVGGLLPPFSATFVAADGDITYTVPATALADVFSISVRDVTASGSPPGTVVACAERSAATPAPAATPNGIPPTGGPPAAPGDGDISLWLYLLIAGGALAVLGGGTLAARARRVN
jgi:hypothetical protein